MAVMHGKAPRTGAASVSVRTAALGPAPRFRVALAHYTLRPPAWRGRARLRIAVVADIHMGPPQMTPGRLARVMRAVDAMQPDLIVDLGDHKADHRFVRAQVCAGTIVAELVRVSAPLGTYAVLGNHDWEQDHAAQARHVDQPYWHGVLERAGVPVLSNCAIKLRAGTRDAVWLAGLDSQRAFKFPRAGKDDLEGALAQTRTDADPVILLAHEPDIFARLPQADTDRRVILTLSGHTHGGQIRIFGYAPVVPSLFGRRYLHGHIREDDRSLIVSGGLGCSGLPLRVGAPPELVFVDLECPDVGAHGAVA